MSEKTEQKLGFGNCGCEKCSKRNEKEEFGLLMIQKGTEYLKEINERKN